ncbi:MAG: acetyl-CoA carboxylase biotin carboxyl carrier protein [Gammaproteobacteria bacterium]|nr:acetyl-CoA carboxylase biotin carboxyl carrier protein [Gammaproteobacteria bacterium]
MDLRKIKKLIELVEESGISELEVSDGDESIRIARPLPGALSAAPAVAVSSAVAPAEAGGAFQFRAPLAGTFYRAGAPGAEPFVSVGQQVEAGDVLCIVESMKMMNEITADKSGRCTVIAVADGEAIGSGQILFHFG